MKNLIAPAIALMLTTIAVHSNAQDLAKTNKKEIKSEARLARNEERKEEVGSQTKDHFLRDFDNTSDAKWVRGPQFDEVTFTQNNQEFTAYYDYQPELVGTTTAKKFTDLPAPAQKEINKQYKNYTIGAVILYDDNDANETNMFIYGNQFDDVDHYFVTVAKGKKEIILKVNTDGEVSYFKQM